MPKTFVLPAHLILYIIGSTLPCTLSTLFSVIVFGLTTCFLLSKNAVFSLLLFFLLPLCCKFDFHENHHYLLEDNRSYTLHAVINDQIKNHQGNRYVLDVWQYIKNDTHIYTSFQLDWTPKECTDLSRGDSIQLRGRFFAYSTESPYESSYEAYRLRKGVLGKLSPYTRVVDYALSHYEVSLDEKIKSHIWNQPKTKSFQNEIGVIEGLLTGVRSRIPQDVLKLYQSTGTIHVMSISGLHVGLLIALLLPFRPKTYTSTLWIWALLCATSLVLFAAYFGHKPSVIRASFMGSILILSKACLRNFPIWNALALAAAIQCALDPIIMFDVGFQLSFGAVLGIILFMPKFLVYTPKNILLKSLYSLCMLSVSAQLFTWPILLSSFGFVSWINPLTNLFVVPFMPIHIIINIVYYVMDIEWIRLPSLILLQWQHGILEVFSHWTWGQYSVAKEEPSLLLNIGIALTINLGIWGALRRSIRIFIVGLIGFTLLLWL